MWLQTFGRWFGRGGGSRTRRLMARARRRQLDAALAGRIAESARHAQRAERLRHLHASRHGQQAGLANTREGEKASAAAPAVVG